MLIFAVEVTPKIILEDIFEEVQKHIESKNLKNPMIVTNYPVKHNHIMNLAIAQGYETSGLKLQSTFKETVTHNLSHINLTTLSVMFCPNLSFEAYRQEISKDIEKGINIDIISSGYSYHSTLERLSEKRKRR